MTGWGFKHRLVQNRTRNIFSRTSSTIANERSNIQQSLVQEAPTLKVSSSETTAAISACDVGPQWPLALEIFRRSGMRSTSTFNGAVSACQEGACWVLPLSLLDLMKTCLVKSDALSFNSVLTCCEKAALGPGEGRLEGAADSGPERLQGCFAGAGCWIPYHQPTIPTTTQLTIHHTTFHSLSFPLPSSSGQALGVLLSLGSRGLRRCRTPRRADRLGGRGRLGAALALGAAADGGGGRRGDGGVLGGGGAGGPWKK